MREPEGAIDMSEDLAELWVAANDHSVCMGGQYVVDYEGDDTPPIPGNPIEIIRLVTEYLKSTT